MSSSSFHLSPRLGACGRVPGWLVSHFLSFVSHFFSFVSQAGCLWSGSWLACLPLPLICLLLFICPAGCLWSGLRLACLPRAFICLPLLSLVSQAGCLWSGSWLACLPLPFICLPICLPGWVLVVGFPAGLSPTSFHMSPTSFHLSPRVPGWLVSYFLSFVSRFFSFVSHFFSFVSQGSRLACLPLPFICLPLLFICLPVLFICLPGWVLVVGFPAGLSPTCFHLSPGSFHLSPRLGACMSLSIGHEAFLFICLPGPSLLVPCSISTHLSFRSVTGGVRPFPLGMQHFYSFVSRVCHWCCRPFLLFLFICLPCLSLLISALFRWISIHLSFRLVTRGVRPFPLFLFMCLPGLSRLVSALFRWPCSISIHLSFRSDCECFVSQVCHCWCPPFSGGDAAFLFICFPGLSLLVSALFRWACSISIHLFPGSVTGAAAFFPLAMSKKLRKSLAPTSRQPLGSIPEHEQPPATLADLASRNAQNPVAPACRNPKTPPDHPGSAQERPHAMTELHHRRPQTVCVFQNRN